MRLTDNEHFKNRFSSAELYAKYGASRRDSVLHLSLDYKEEFISLSIQTDTGSVPADVFERRRTIWQIPINTDMVELKAVLKNHMHLFERLQKIANTNVQGNYSLPYTIESFNLLQEIQDLIDMVPQHGGYYEDACDYFGDFQPKLTGNETDEDLEKCVEEAVDNAHSNDCRIAKETVRQYLHSLRDEALEKIS
jgi:hypothetical protein